MHNKNGLLFIIICILLTACNSEDSTSTNNSEMVVENNQSINESNNTSDDEYHSIRDYYNFITGETYKTGILDIDFSKNKEEFLLTLDVWIDPELQDRFINTEKDYWFIIGGIPGNDLIQKNIAEIPEPINGKSLIANIEENLISIEQKMILNKDISNSDLNELLKPENYSFEMLDENKDPTAATLGLELDMIN